MNKPYKDFFIDESPNGERYFIDGELVSQTSFLERRQKECNHRRHSLVNPKIKYQTCAKCGSSVPKIRIISTAKVFNPLTTTYIYYIPYFVPYSGTRSSEVRGIVIGYEYL